MAAHLRVFAIAVACALALAAASAAYAQCTGGCAITTVGGDTVLTFTSNGTFTPPSGVTSVQYLVVGGGGGGGGIAAGNQRGGGGSGAGGYQAGTGFAVTPLTPYNITVGAGGAGGSNNNQGGNGSSSSFSTVTAVGGGGGASTGSDGSNGADGGSGGGGRLNGGNGGNGAAGQGNNGGDGGNANGAGGGGGANAAGTNGGNGTGGNGGAGTANNISGTNTTYAGGGGGGRYTGNGGSGGAGGGGTAPNGRGNGGAGTANTGGGGAGASGSNSGAGGSETGGAGGSGIVIVRYTPPPPTYYSRASANWGTGTTWSTISCTGMSAGTTPVAGSAVVICGGNTVTVNTATANLGSLTVQAAGVLNGNNAITVSGTTSVSGTINATTNTGTKTFTGATTVMSGGTMTLGASTVNFGSTIDVAGTVACTSNTGTKTFTGALTVQNGGLVDLQACTATFNDVATVQSGGALTLTTSATGTKTFNGNVAIDSGGTWNDSVNEAITMGGDLINDGNFSSGTGAYTFSGNGQFGGGQPISFGGAVNVNASIARINNSASTVSVAGNVALGNNATMTNNGTVTITGNLTGGNGSSAWTNAANSTLNAGNAVLTTGTLNASASGNTVNYNGTGGQTVKLPSGGNYFNLIVSTQNTKTPAAGTYNILGDLTINSGPTFNANTNDPTINVTGNVVVAGTYTGSNSAALTVGGNLSIGGAFTGSGGAVNLAGNFSNSGSFASGAGVYTFNGSATQNVSGSGTLTFTSLTLSNASGISLGSNVTVTAAAGGTLTLTVGEIMTNAYTLVTGRACSAPSVSRASGYVVGNLQKAIPAGASTCTFEIGDVSSYTPVVMTFPAGTVAGNLTASTTAGDHPQINSSNLDPTQSVNRYWTLTSSGFTVGGAGATATFNFVAGDVDGGADTGGFIIGAYAGSTWAYPAVGTRTSTSSQATGLTAATIGGDFAIADQRAGTPYSYWRMNEGSWNGTASEVGDYGSGGNPGTAASLLSTPPPTTAAASPALPGSPGTCGYGVFNRADKDYIALPSGYPNLGHDSGYTSFTITAWIRSTDVTQSGQRILIDDETNNGGWGLSLGDGGTGLLRFFSRGSSTQILDSSVALSNDTWYFVAVSFNVGANTVANMYVYDATGTLVASSTATWTGFTWGADSGSPSIGGETNGASSENTSSFGFAGNIDEVRVYLVPLTQLQIAQVRQLGNVCQLVDHYELSVPLASITCLPTAVTVTACADSSNPCTNVAAAINGTASLGTSGGSIVSPVNVVSGVATSALSDPGAADNTAVTVSLAGASIPAPNAYTCRGGTGCTTTFNTAGFIVSDVPDGGAATVPSQVAGVASGTYYLRAVQTNTATRACDPAFSGVSTAVNFAYECNDPATCYTSDLMSVNGGTPTTVSRNNNGSVSSYASVPVTFDANGNAPFTFTYNDAGKVTLWIAKTVNGAALAGSSNAFVVKPYDFGFSAIQRTSDAFANPGASGASGAKFVKAGEAFSATVTARAFGGTTTPSFGLGSNNGTESVGLAQTLVAPAGGASGSLGGTASILRSSFANGVATVTNLTWSEVGVITLTATNSTFLGQPLATTGTSGNIGRFYPDHFAVVSSAIINRSDATCSPGSTFTYMGEPFSVGFSLEARNLADAKTQNYATANGFAKLDPTAAGALSFGARDAGGAGTVLTSRLDTGGAPTGSFIGGAAAIAASVGLTRAASPDGPYESLHLGIAPVDSDGVVMNAYDLDADGTAGAERKDLGVSTKARFGRLRLIGTAGSALLPARISLQAQYWNGTAFAANADDSCTTLAASDFALSSYRAPLAACNTAATGGVTFASGGATLILARPSPANTGSVVVTANLDSSPPGGSQYCPSVGGAPAAATGAILPYLQGNWSGSGWSTDPSARVGFGVYGSQPSNFIFNRENY